MFNLRLGIACFNDATHEMFLYAAILLYAPINKITKRARSYKKKTGNIMTGGTFGSNFTI